MGSLRPEFPGCSWPWLSQAAAWTRGIVAKCEETIRHRTLVYGIPVSQIIFVYNIKILILREKNGKAVYWIKMMTTCLKSSHIPHSPLQPSSAQQLIYRHYTIIKCFMFNFAPFIPDTIHDWGADRVWAESPAQARGCQAINPWSRWDEEYLMTPHGASWYQSLRPWHLTVITAAVHAEVTTKLHHRNSTFHLLLSINVIMVAFNESSDV